MPLTRALRENHVLAAFSDAELDALVRSMTVSAHPDGEVLIAQGDGRVGQSAAMYIVLEGHVEVSVDVAGTKQPIKTLGPGDLFGLLTLLEPAVRAATCQARGPVKVGSLSRGPFEWILSSHIPLAARFQQAVARQLARDLRRANGAVIQAVEARHKGQLKHLVIT